MKGRNRNHKSVLGVKSGMGHSPPPFPVVRHKRVYSRVSTNKVGLTIDTSSTRQNEDLRAIQ